MPKPLLALGAALAVLSACPRLSLAWSVNGHKIVAQLAQDALGKDADGQNALAAIKTILGPAYGPTALANIAPCADFIRSTKDDQGNPRPPGTVVPCGGLNLPVMPQSQPWHFVDLPVTSAPGSASGVCNGGCVIDAIARQADVLSGKSAGDKKLALMFVVHLVGDAHQPLHCAIGTVADGLDHGFNCEQVSIDGARISLHSLWDHRVSAVDAPNWQAEAQRLGKQLPTDGVSGDAASLAKQAAQESFGDAQTIFAEFQKYPGYPAQDCKNDKTNPPVVLPGNYASEYAKIVDERLQMAGARLAAILKAALAAPPAANP